MKLSRLAASAVGVGIVATSALAFVAPANAATPGITFVTASDVDAAAVIGTIGWGNLGTGPVTSSLNGLAVPDSGELHFGFNGAVPMGGNTLVGTGSATAFTVSSDSDIYAEFSWFTDAAETDEQWLYSTTNSSESFTDPLATFVSTTAVGIIPAFTPATLAAFDDEFDLALPDAAVAGVALYNDSGASVNVYTFLAGGNPFYFTPTPAPAAGPATISPADLATPGMGFTATTTGFVPNEGGDVYIDTPDGGGPVGSFVVDANGAVLFTYVAFDGTSPLGAYTLILVGNSGVVQFFDFSVVAAALAATGVDATVTVAAGGALLLGGAALALVAAKRRKSA